jgi:hypothetical protein
MFNEKDIIERLRNNEKIEDIANELTNALNAANAEYERQKEEERAEKAKKELEEKRAYMKEKELQGILELFNDWMAEYYDLPKGDPVELEAAEIIKVIDEAVNVLRAVQVLDLTNIFTPKEKEPEKKTATPEEVIEKFLKSTGW